MAFICDQGAAPHRGDAERCRIETAEQFDVLVPFADPNEHACHQAPCIERGTVRPQRSFRLRPVRYIAEHCVRQFRSHGAFEIIQVQDILQALRHTVGAFSPAPRRLWTRTGRNHGAHSR